MTSFNSIGLSYVDSVKVKALKRMKNIANRISCN